MSKRVSWALWLILTVATSASGQGISFEVRDDAHIWLRNQSSPVRLAGVEFISVGRHLEPIQAVPLPTGIVLPSAPFDHVLANSPFLIALGNLGSEIVLDGEVQTVIEYDLATNPTWRGDLYGFFGISDDDQRPVTNRCAVPFEEALIANPCHGLDFGILSSTDLPLIQEDAVQVAASGNAFTIESLSIAGSGAPVFEIPDFSEISLADAEFASFDVRILPDVAPGDYVGTLTLHTARETASGVMHEDFSLVDLRAVIVPEPALSFAWLLILLSGCVAAGRPSRRSLNRA